MFFFTSSEDISDPQFSMHPWMPRVHISPAPVATTKPLIVGTIANENLTHFLTEEMHAQPSEEEELCAAVRGFVSNKKLLLSYLKYPSFWGGYLSKMLGYLTSI